MFTVGQIAPMTNLGLASVHFILKKNLKVRKVNAPLINIYSLRIKNLQGYIWLKTAKEVPKISENGIW